MSKLQVMLLTSSNRLQLSVLTPLQTLYPPSQSPLVFMVILVARNIQVYRLWWAVVRRPFLKKICQSWSTRSISRAGKEILIKSVFQAIPSYCMGAFLIPTSLCKEIERITNSFHWCSKKNARHDINWMCWDKLTLHKSLGGFDFRNLVSNAGNFSSTPPIYLLESSKLNISPDGIS